MKILYQIVKNLTIQLMSVILLLNCLLVVLCRIMMRCRNMLLIFNLERWRVWLATRMMVCFLLWGGSISLKMSMLTCHRLNIDECLSMISLSYLIIALQQFLILLVKFRLTRKWLDSVVMGIGWTMDFHIMFL